MARRKSAIAAFIDSVTQARLAREAAEAKAQQQYQQELAQYNKRQRQAYEKQVREAAKAQAARQRRDEAAAKAEAKRVADDARAAAAQERRGQAEARAATRGAAAELKQAQLVAIEQKVAQAAHQTEAAAARQLAQSTILLVRNRHLHRYAVRAEAAFNDRGPDGLVAEVQAALARSLYPDGLTGAVAGSYLPESRELLIEYELPRQEAVPSVRSYRYVKAKDAILPEPVKEAELKKAYGRLLARVVLRTVAEVFDATPVTLVAGIALNGYVSAKDRATGKPVRPLLISVNATREEFGELVLDEPELDPELCLRSFLNAIVSPHPYDLEAVRPVLNFDLMLSRYKFVDEMSIVAGLDSRPDLLSLKPVEFEHLVRELFEAIGMKSWVTQASKDDGVDAVAVNEDPIVGGLCIIQAKRYSRIVGLELVNALAGVMADKRAAKGVLVTTSWVGKASRDFAARNGRIEIIEGRHLKSMLREHLGIDVLIGLPHLPPGWETHDVT